MKIEMLDHIALYLSDRDTAGEFLTSHLGFHLIDRTERYTLVGAGGRIGKLTLFDAPEGTTPRPGIIDRINIRVEDPRFAATKLPQDANVELQDDEYFFTGPESLPFALVSADGEFTDYDLEGLILRSRNPEESARGFVQMGFGQGGDTTVKAGEYRLHLVPDRSDREEQQMLFHLGCLVASAEGHRNEAEEQGFEIQAFVEGPNSLAVFVRGPEDVSVEYVEHKPTFSLT